MRELSIVVEELRRVQDAKRQFVERWIVEQDVINPMLDRVAEEIERDLAGGDFDEPGPDVGQPGGGIN